ncbi:MAG: hypothetical protein WB561_07070 [Terracidiphilus sp.]
MNPALAEPAATVTEAGTVSAALLLVSETVVALVAGALKDTVQTFDCAPVSDCVPHETVLNAPADAEALLYVIPPHPERTAIRDAASNDNAPFRMRLLVERNECRKKTGNSKELGLT